MNYNKQGQTIGSLEMFQIASRMQCNDNVHTVHTVHTVPKKMNISASKTFDNLKAISFQILKPLLIKGFNI